jgi:tetratricopeptide (TPR) repeat protein
MYFEADRVFHSGVGEYRKSAFENWFVRMQKLQKPSGHRHLNGKDALEIMPYLYFSTRFNPHNVEAYAVTAFWLAGEGKRVDLAEKVLQEAQRNNPRNFLVYKERTRLKIKLGEYKEAASLADIAFMLWNEKEKEAKNGSPDLDNHAKAELLLYRGLLYELEKQNDKAIACYEELLAMFPKRGGVATRIEGLKKNGKAEPSPVELFQNLSYKHSHVCDMEESNSHHHDEAEHHHSEH